MLVYVASFEMGCCGVPAAVGDEVAWLLYEHNGSSRLRNELGGDIAAFATWHHGGMTEPADAPMGGLLKTRGNIRRVWDLYSRYRERGEPGNWFPIEGTESVVPANRLVRFSSDTPTLPDRHDGWVVDLDLCGDAHVYPKECM